MQYHKLTIYSHSFPYFLFRSNKLAGKLEAGLEEQDIPDFLYIEENDFSKYERSSSQPSTSSKGKLAEEVFPCECRWPGGWNIDEVSASKLASVACGKDANCINRTLFIECRAKDCPCGDRCQNQRFQKCQYKDIEIIKAPGKGHGLRTREDLQAGDFVIEYVGEVVSPLQMHKRVEMNLKIGQKHYYFMTLQNDQILDATRKGNLARFMNHSCNPNCATQKWIVNGKVRIGLFALRAIPAGTELTFDYKFVRFSSSSQAQACLCGEPNCKGFIGTVRNKKHGEDDETMFWENDDDDDTGADNDNEGGVTEEGIEDVEDVPSIAKALLRKEKEADLMPLIQTLRVTRSQTCLKRFVSLHGLQILQMILGQHGSNLGVVKAIVDVLRILPVPSKNVLDDSGIVGRLEKILKGQQDDKGDLSSTIEELLANWSDLEHSFRIPKASSASLALEESSTLSTPVDVSSVTPSDTSSTAAAAVGYRVQLEDPRFKVSKWSTATVRDASGDTEDLRRRRDQPYRQHQQQHDRKFESAPKRVKPSASFPVSPVTPLTAALPEGWRETRTADGKPYYYNELTRETRWEPPPSALPTATISDIQVEGLKDEGIARIISRAKAAVLARTNEADVVKPSESKDTLSNTNQSATTGFNQIRDEISSFVVKFLSRYKNQFKGPDDFKEMARKLTHGLADKEHRSMLLLGNGPFEMSKQKRHKIALYLAQYLQSHGFKDVKDVDPSSS